MTLDNQLTYVVSLNLVASKQSTFKVNGEVLFYVESLPLLFDWNQWELREAMINLMADGALEHTESTFVGEPPNSFTVPVDYITFLFGKVFSYLYVGSNLIADIEGIRVIHNKEVDYMDNTIEYLSDSY
ncbi:hypothetical protein WN943_014882 [Citrus x changshan-huyou]